MAVVTSCHHFFHGACLRKWLYVQDSCPMCHQRVTPAATKEDGDAGAAARPVPAHEDEVRGDGGAPARPRRDGAAPGEPLGGGGGASRDDGAGISGPRLSARADPPAPGEGEAAAVPPPSPRPGAAPRTDGPPRQPAPSAASTDRSALGAGRGQDGSGDPRLS